MLDAIKKKYDEFQQARIRERVAQMNAEGADARDAEAKAEAARLAAVSQAVRAGSAERTAPPVQTGMARRAAPMTLGGGTGVPAATLVNGKRRAQVIDEQAQQAAGVQRR